MARCGRRRGRRRSGCGGSWARCGGSRVRCGGCGGGCTSRQQAGTDGAVTIARRNEYNTANDNTATSNPEKIVTRRPAHGFLGARWLTRG